VAKGRNADRKDDAALVVGLALLYTLLFAVLTFVGSAIRERSLVEGFRQWPWRTWWEVPVAALNGLLLALVVLWLKNKNWEERRKGRKIDGEGGG